MNICLSQELAERYLSGSCSIDEQHAIETHITECEKCRLRIESGQSSTGSSNLSDVTKTHDKTVTYDPKTVTYDYPEKTKSYVSGDEKATTPISPPPVPSSSHTPPVLDELSKSMFEGYEILEQLPVGGQAVVYKATQKATKRVVALKVLLQGPHVSKLSQYRFEREVDLAASLQHPNIVTIYDSGIAKGQYYFAMQYIKGKPLDKYIRSEKLPIRKTMELFNKICSAIAYAHQRGVIHRDLKPDNILVDAEGEPHILDFGLAKLIDGSEKTSPEMVMTTIPGKVIGTLAFMSPEQASAKPDAIDVRTDVYSIGVILYKILTGNFPYDVSGSMLAILRNIQESEATKPSKIHSHFNSEVEAILMKALTKEPTHRYQSAAHLQQDIDSWLKGLPIAARSDSSIYLLYKIMTRHYYTSAVAALLLIIIFGFSCVSYQLYNRYRKSNITLEETNQSLNREIARYSGLTLKASFTHFLQNWHTNQLKNSEYIAKFFIRGTKESAAASFMLNPKPLPEKIAKFRHSLGSKEPCFVEFIIAEHYLKNGNTAEAIKGYHKCLKHVIRFSQRKYTGSDF
ncbi:MAG: protein kinase domain-containing protein [Planctomycetota bacterium]|jgi:serine/threonine protein kinase